MIKPLLVVVTGAPASGKTYLANFLSEKLGLPIYSKDSFKEKLFDVLKFDDWSMKQKLGIASFYMVDLVTQINIKSKQSFIIEGNFRPKSSDDLVNILKTYTGTVVQVLCKANKEILLSRFKNRSETDRHDVHNDEVYSAQLEKDLDNNEYSLLDLESQNIVVDTSDFDKVDYEAILNEVKLYM